MRRANGLVLTLLTVLSVDAQPLHLVSPVDRDSFRRWFSFLAESQYYRSRPDPAIGDCSGLVRWAMRESLAVHDAAWANRLQLPVFPGMPAVRQYAYPRTPAGPNLFQVTSEATGEFADAATLYRLNSYFFSREIDLAKPGDLLFFKQWNREMAWHVMIYIGASQIVPSAERWLLYHSGPKGEIRKVSLTDLLRHPAPEWRPSPGNSNFLGVRRLNLLRDME